VFFNRLLLNRLLFNPLLFNGPTPSLDRFTVTVVKPAAYITFPSFPKRGSRF
jgi:hypothetical protein